jgi:phospholipase/lecithinase/hemolysin
LAVSLALGIFLPCASASYSTIYAFGDSLSDAGNIFAGTFGATPPSPPYYHGEFSNGPVWVQDLAAQLGLGSLKPSLLGGTDFAYGGGETGVTSFNISDPRTDILGANGQVGTQGQLYQFEQYLLAHSIAADPQALYTIWIGSNDLADIAATDPANAVADVGKVVGNIDATVNDLAQLGAKNFLILNVPDLGTTPMAISQGPAAQAALSQLSAGLDAALVPSFAALAAADGVNIQTLNTYLLLDSIVASPPSFGFTDVTDPCLVGITACANPNQFLFWDNQHPTAAAQAIVAGAARPLVTPEPGYISLVGVGLIGLVLARRRIGN